MANIKLNNKTYPIPDSKLATATGSFISHLGTIAGNGLKVVIGGVEYGVDAAKVAGAIAGLDGTLGGLHVKSPAGLYQTGAIALYEEQGANAIKDMQIKSWDDLLADGTIRVDSGMVYTNLDTDEWTNASSDALSGDLILPDDGGITALGENAFAACSNLTSVAIVSGVTSIGESAFDSCSNLTTVIIPDSVTNIGDYAFYDCSRLTSVVIPDGVTSIGQNTFYGCSSLTSVVIPEGVTMIGQYAFRNCSSLTSVVIPDSVTKIEGSAFNSCSSLASVIIPEGVTMIGSYAFHNCTSLTSVVIPDNVTKIESCAFSGCSNLTSVTIGSGVTSIGNNAFNGCSSLVEVINKSSLTFTRYSTSNGYVAYYAIEVHNGESKLVNYNDYLFYATEAGTNYLLKYTGTETNLVLPESCNGEPYEIYKNTFSGYTNLTSVVIPDSVTDIGQYAFNGCSGLTSVTIGSGVTSIGQYAFQNCPSLTSVVIPEGVTNIGDYAFQNCSSLTSATIPDSVTSIGRQAFYDCSSLTSVVIPEGVTSIGTYTFYGCTNMRAIFCGATTQPAGWSSSWNAANYLVIWGYSGEEYTYVFISDGTAAIDPITSTGLITLPCITKENYYLDGWYDNSEFSGEPVSDIYYSSTKHTLYAKWLTEEEYLASLNGTSFKKAYIINSGETLPVVIDVAGKHVYFKFTATENKTYEFRASGESGDSYGHLYDINQKEIITDDDGTGDSHFLMSKEMTIGETVYIKARLYSSSKTATFNFSVN